MAWPFFDKTGIGRVLPDKNEKSLGRKQHKIPGLRDGMTFPGIKSMLKKGRQPIFLVI
jgi:hypothetical protein